MQVKKYKNTFEYSYTLGPFPSFELISAMPENVLCVYASEKFNDKDKLENVCKSHGIEFIISDKQLSKISDKELCYAGAVFRKYTQNLNPEKSHIVLHNPADMGNIGTIIRTALAFKYKDLAIIKPCADIFNPKAVRASMGAMFKLNIEMFDSFEDYAEKYGQNRDMFPFMLSSKKNITLDDVPNSNKFSLIFGNESRGLPTEFEDIGTPIFIPQSDEVDSLNLSISVALGIYKFSR